MEQNNFWKNRRIPFSKTEEEAWEELQMRMEQSKLGSVKVISMRPIYAAAAAVAVLLGAYFFFNQSVDSITIATNNGDYKEVTLPDGSSAKLAPGSTLSFAEEWDANRLVVLKGQAFFEVKKGSNFKVHTEIGDVSVLGTSFDVNTNEGFKVFCKTGKVLVESAGQTTVLTPGLQSKLSAENKLETTSRIANENQWIDGKLSFENESLEAVLNEIERFYNVDINCKVTEGKLYTGQFSLNNLEEALTLVCAPFGLEYKIENGMKINIQ
ncbi:MAG: FecR domain-containing protein [Flavobacteriales bacterium]